MTVQVASTIEYRLMGEGAHEGSTVMWCAQLLDQHLCSAVIARCTAHSATGLHLRQSMYCFMHREAYCLCHVSHAREISILNIVACSRRKQWIIFLRQAAYACCQQTT